MAWPRDFSLACIGNKFISFAAACSSMQQHLGAIATNAVVGQVDVRESPVHFQAGSDCLASQGMRPASKRSARSK